MDFRLGLGDVGFFLALLPLFSHLLPFLKQVVYLNLTRKKLAIQLHCKNSS